MIVNHNAALGAPAWLSSADNGASSAKAESAASFAAMLRKSQPQAPLPAPIQLQAPPATAQPVPQPAPQVQKQASAPAPQPTRPAAGMPNSTAPEAAATPSSTQTQDTRTAQQADDAAATEQTNSARSNAAAKPKARVAEKPATSSSGNAKPATDATADAAKPTETADANQPTAANASITVDPTLAQFLASLQLGRAPAASTGLSLAAQAGKDAAATAEGDSAKPAFGEGGKALDAAADLQAKADPTASALGGRDSKGAGAFAALLDQHGTEAAAGAQPAAIDSKGVQAPTAAFGDIAPASSNAASSADSAAAPTSVNVPTPVDSPDFPKALGVQLSVLARDGIQHAELHLNPTDMGPVSVNIVMDGTQARVDFGADVAATRQAIEAGLPELASALRDAGFTLTGGGVSQQASQQQSSSGRGDGSGGDGNGRARSLGGVSGSDSAEPAARASRRTVSAGGLDLYA